jgi:hypothetical protein
MGRPRKPIVGSGPVKDFARQLRTWVDSAPATLTTRVLGELVHCSPDTISVALGGATLPSDATLRGIVRACGGSEQDVKEWLQFRADTHRAADRLRIKVLEFGPLRGDPAAGVGAGGRREFAVITPEVADPGQCEPDPDAAHTFEDLRHQLALLRIAAGSPSYRTMSRTIAEYTDNHYSVTTLNDLFTGQRAPGHEVFAAIVTTLLRLAVDDIPASWRMGGLWSAAWRRAEYNRLRPDLTQRRHTGLYLVPEHQDHGPAPSVIERMDTEQAAMLLAGMDPGVVAGLIGQLPPTTAKKILTAMQQLTGPITPVPPTGPTGGGITETTDYENEDGHEDGGGEDLGVSMTEPG